MSKNYLDSKKALHDHSERISQNGFLHLLYEEFYSQLLSGLPKNGKVIELGSGGGFIKSVNPKVITSDVEKSPGIDKVFFAEKMPFKSSSVDAFVMQNVFHHIKEPGKALSEMQRCLVKGGKIAMIEPYNTLWGKFIYTHFHHEVFDTTAGWKIEGEGRMSDANGAIPWIVFKRDRLLFEKKFPNLAVLSVVPHTPFAYLFSGGVSHNQLVPTGFYYPVRQFEKLLSPINKSLGMFVTIKLEKL